MKLCVNEKITSDYPHHEEIENLSDEEINIKYSMGDVRIVTEQARYPLNSIPAMLESGDYVLQPDFQRRHRWNDRKRSKLIESIIMNVPLPPIFLYETDYSSYEVMDGLQRLTAIKKFYNDEFSLQDLELWPELNGKVYSKLPLQIKKGIDRRYLSSIILLQETAKTETQAAMLKQLVFERINSGGVKLSLMESRNALYPGPLTDLAHKLSRSETFCLLFDLPPDDELEEAVNSGDSIENELYQTMKDVELVIRFFGNRQRKDFSINSVGKYFDFYLNEGNKFPKEVLDELENIFLETCDLIYSVLGEKAFWMWRKRINKGNTSWAWLARSTIALYDPMMSVFSNHLNDKKILIQKKDDIQKSLIEFYKDNYESFSGRSNQISNITLRTDLFEEFLVPFL